MVELAQSDIIFEDRDLTDAIQQIQENVHKNNKVTSIAKQQVNFINLI